MTRSTTSGVRVAIAVLVVTAAAGCSSSGPSGGHSSGASSGPSGGHSAAATDPSSATGTAAASGAPASGAGTQPDAATRAAITSAFTTFFGSDATTPQDVAVLQHGSLFTKTIDEQGKSSYSDKSSAKVTAVVLHGDVADVTFSVLSNGKTLLPGFEGNAVREDGRWKVAAKTFCALLTLEGDAPAACKDPSVTALPH